MEVEAEILEPLQLHYSDLLLLSSSYSSCTSTPPRSSGGAERRLEALSRSVMEALGPRGPGLLCVSGVPGVTSLRRSLLPLARSLALLCPPDRARVLKIHGLGTDVPLKNLDRIVSSFALQLKYHIDRSSDLILDGSSHEVKHMCMANENIKVDLCDDSWEDKFQMLGCTFRQLGLSMITLGVHVARICDRAIGGQELEKSILESCSAKGRLIHYHSSFDNVILKEIMRKTRGLKHKKSGSTTVPQHVIQRLKDALLSQMGNEVKDDDKVILNETAKSSHRKVSLSELWQQWHHDYGIFTILTAPMFLGLHELFPTDGKEHCPGDKESCIPDNNTYLQLFMPARNKIFLVKSPPESLIVQIGEAADILTRGKLRSTLHSVARPKILENVSRETFVVFLQPAWDKLLFLPDYLTTACGTCNNQSPCGNGPCLSSSVDDDVQSHDSVLLKQEIFKSVPPLSSRLRDGMTFAEFSKETTRQYYGGSGIQSPK